MGNGEQIKGTTNRFIQNGLDYQTMSAGSMYQTVKNLFPEIPLDKSSFAMAGHQANQKNNSWDSSSKGK